MKSAKGNNNCSLVAEFSLVQEYILLQDERITQLYVIQSEQNPFLWFGILFVDSGIYMGTVIRFNMIIDDNYPNCSCPRIIFNPIPYHPLIDPESGILDTKNAFPDWNSKTHKLHQLLHFVKRVICQAELYINKIRELISQHTSGEFEKNDDFFLGNNEDDQNNISINETRSQLIKTSNLNNNDNNNILKADDYEQQLQQTSSSNMMTSSNVINLSNEAFEGNLINLFQFFDKTLDCIRVYENNPEEFLRRVDKFKLDVGLKLFDKPESCNDDKNSLVFRRWDPDFHEPIRQCLLAGKFTPTHLFASYHKETDSVSFVPGKEEEEE